MGGTDSLTGSLRRDGRIHKVRKSDLQIWQCLTRKEIQIDIWREIEREREREVVREQDPPQTVSVEPFSLWIDYVVSGELTR